MKEDPIRRFLEDRDETGKFKVVSLKTGVTYYVEPIGDGRGGNWGSENPATKEIEHKKGDGKYAGSVTEKESVISEANGFKNVTKLDVGESPMDEITRRDDEHYANGVRAK